MVRRNGCASFSKKALKPQWVSNLWDRNYHRSTMRENSDSDSKPSATICLPCWSRNSAVLYPFWLSGLYWMWLCLQKIAVSLVGRIVDTHRRFFIRSCGTKKIPMAKPTSKYVKYEWKNERAIVTRCKKHKNNNIKVLSHIKGIDVVKLSS